MIYNNSFSLLYLFFHIIEARFSFAPIQHILIDLLPPREVLTALGLILTEGPVLAARSGTVFKTNLIALAGRVSLIRDTQVRVGAWADRSIGTGLEPLLARLLALAELDTRAFVDIFRLPATFGTHEK